MNRITKTIVSTISIILAIAGLAHGIPEILQGNTPTEGLIIQAIGPDNRMWHYGTEEAFSLLPTYLSTGLAAIAISLALIVWSLGFVHTKRGATALGLLFIGLSIAITGYLPGQSDPEVILNICWAFIFIGGLGLFLVTFVAGFAHDIEQTVAG
ncbi:MAG: hypothetical protein R6W69_03540 [Anaerolineales bacterium]